MLDDWAVSGITSSKPDFLSASRRRCDNELINSFDFELPGEPNQLPALSGKGRKATGTIISIALPVNFDFHEAGVFWLSGQLDPAPSAVDRESAKAILLW